MKKFYLAGAGGFAREIFSYLIKRDLMVDGYRFSGFLSDFPASLDDFNIEFTIIDRMMSHGLTANDAVIIAVADCNLKEDIFKHYNKLGIKVLTYIHETAFIGRNVKIGEGAVICPNTILTCDIEIGVAVTINAHSSIGHDVKLGDFCTLSGHCDVTGRACLDHKVFMGSHALIIPNVNVGEGAIIGAGSVVLSKVKPGNTVFGNPAKKIK